MWDSVDVPVSFYIMSGRGK